MNDLKFAFRQLLKNPGFTVVAVLTLALGIGATTATVSAVRGALIDPIPVDHPERFVSLHATDIESGRRSHGLNPVAAREAEAAKDLFEQVILWKRHTANDNLTFEESSFPQPLFGTSVSRGFFRFFGIRPVSLGVYPMKTISRPTLNRQC